jgi:hypothetical protein
MFAVDWTRWEKPAADDDTPKVGWPEPIQSIPRSLEPPRRAPAPVHTLMVSWESGRARIPEQRNSGLAYARIPEQPQFDPSQFHWMDPSDPFDRKQLYTLCVSADSGVGEAAPSAPSGGAGPMEEAD